MAKVRLIVTNIKTKIECELKLLKKLDKAFSIRNPNAFFIRRYMPKGWDGLQHYITDAGYMKTPLLPMLVEEIQKEGYEVEMVDKRVDIPRPIIPKKVGKNTLRPYQAEGIKAITHNKVKDLIFPVGVIDAATNAGKTTIATGIYLAYQRKVPAIMLLNDGDLFNQFLEEIPRLIGKEDFGHVRGKVRNWNRFTIAMVQTLSQNIGEFKEELEQFGICLVDEADLGSSKTYKSVLNNLINSTVKVGLSGTIYMSKLAKDRMKNWDLKSFFGEPVFKITKREMVDMGYSTELVIKIVTGNTQQYKGDNVSYHNVYEQLITRNEERNKRALDRLVFNMKRGRLPALIICRFHPHTDVMYDLIQKELGHKIVVKKAYHSTKDRVKIMRDFRDGKIDVLVTTYIVKRGKNFPLIRYIQNVSGGDSNETISQIMGRGERKHKGKNKVYIDDFFDEGKYLLRHSKHRINYYKKEQFKTINIHEKSKRRRR